MSFHCKLGHKLPEELHLVRELVSDTLKLLGSCVALHDVRAVFLDQTTKFLDVYKNLGYKLSNFGFFAAHH